MGVTLEDKVDLSAAAVQSAVTKMKTPLFAIVLGILGCAATCSTDFATEMLEATFKFFDPAVAVRTVCSDPGERIVIERRARRRKSNASRNHHLARRFSAF